MPRVQVSVRLRSTRTEPPLSSLEGLIDLRCTEAPQKTTNTLHSATEELLGHLKLLLDDEVTTLGQLEHSPDVQVASQVLLRARTFPPIIILSIRDLHPFLVPLILCGPYLLLSRQLRNSFLNHLHWYTWWKKVSIARQTFRNPIWISWPNWPIPILSKSYFEQEHQGGKNTMNHAHHKSTAHMYTAHWNNGFGEHSSA